METLPTSIPKLPDDVIREILVRLPVKSLSQLKCVSKSWLSSILDPQFVKNHLRFSEEDPDLTHRKVILSCRGNLMLCSLHSLFYDPFTAASETDLSVKFSSSLVWVVGSCNGLICISVDKKDLFLWNPSIRKYKQLPDFGVKRNYDSYFAYGLGYDKASDDYKVVGIFNSDKYSSEMIMKVYSLKSDQWRSIENFKGRRLMADPSKFVDGKLYWFVSRDSALDSRWDIVSLDLETEEYEVLPMPDDAEDCSYSRMGVSKGCLYVFCSHSTSADIWIVDNYDAEKRSWTKLISIPYVDDLMKYSYITPLDVLNSGEVLLLCGSKFVVFDPKDGSFRYPEIRNSSSLPGAASTFIESLVSPLGLQ